MTAKIPPQARRAKPTLNRQVQCRFTDAQFDLLNAIAEELDRPISAIVRDVVTVWALNFVSDPLEGLSRARHDSLVRSLVAELRAVEDQP